MKNKIAFVLIVFLQFMLVSCKEKNTNQEVQTPLISVKTTVIQQGNIENYIRLNGKTIYLKKNRIVSPISGYVINMNVKYGDIVQKNDIMFELQTKESKALSNNIGDIKVLASSGGIVSELIVNQSGTYLVEGDLLCTIVENRDLIIQVNVPYEYKALLQTGANCKIMLPDNTMLEGAITKILPTINEINQTQLVLIKPDTKGQLPENLNLTVRFIIEKHTNSLLISKEAVMTNEKQSEFWLMKIVNDSMAVKIPIHKGIENDSIVEILSQGLNKNDLIISEGAYGLPDSSIVKIAK